MTEQVAAPLRPRWILFVGALGAVTFAAVAVYLLNPTAIDLGTYISPRRYELLAYVLIYASVALACTTIFGEHKSGWAIADLIFAFAVGPAALFGLGLVFAFLVGAFFVAPNAIGPTPILLAIPAATCFAVASAVDTARRIRTARTTIPNGQTIWAAPARTRWSTYATIVIGAAFLMVLLALAAGVGGATFMVLRVNLIDGRTVDVAQFAQALPEILTATTRNAGPRLFVIPALLAFLALLFEVGVWIARLFRGPRRELTAQEVAYAERSAVELESYAAEQGYAKEASRVAILMLATVFGAILVAGILGLGSPQWLAPYSQNELNALGWHVYDMTMGISGVAIMFVLILASPLPSVVLFRFYPRFAEAFGWAGFTSKNAPMSPLQVILAWLRGGRLSADRPFDAGGFLRNFATFYMPYFLWPALALGLITVELLRHDTSRYYLLTDDRIEVMDYWTLEKRHFPYSAVEKVTLNCAGTGAAGYEIALPDGLEADVSTNRLPNGFADLIRIDRKIPPGTPREFGTRKPLFQEEVSTYKPECVESLTKDMNTDDAARLRGIFRIDNWYRQQWKARTVRPN